MNIFPLSHTLLRLKASITGEVFRGLTTDGRYAKDPVRIDSLRFRKGEVFLPINPPKDHQFCVIAQDCLQTDTLVHISLFDCKNLLHSYQHTQVESGEFLHCWRRDSNRSMFNPHQRRCVLQ